MPLYEYKCKQCHERLEKIQSFSAQPEKICPKCGGELERVISAPAIQFKGAGWYVNDYAKSGSKPAKATDSSSKSEGNADISAAASGANSDSSGSKPSVSSSDAGASSGSTAPSPSVSPSNSGAAKPSAGSAGNS